MPDAIKVLNDLNARLRAAFPGEVADVVLFGSQAKGTATEDSDYDFLVITLQNLTALEEAAWSRICYQTDVHFGICTDVHFLSEAGRHTNRGLQPVFFEAYKSGLKAA